MKLIKFKDLEFTPHKYINNAVSCYIRFTDEEYISIVGGDKNSGLYGNGETSFEIKSNLTDLTEEGVLSYVSKEEVNEHLKQIQLNTLMKLTYKN